MSKNILQELCQKHGFLMPTYTHVRNGDQWISTVCITMPDGRILSITSNPAARKVDADQGAAFLALQAVEPIRIATPATPATPYMTGIPTHIIVDYENIANLDNLPSLAATSNHISLYVVVGYCNQRADDPLVTHVIRSAGSDAADHAITYLCGMIACAAASDCLIFVVTRDKFGAHLKHASKLRINGRPEHKIQITHCTTARECIALLHVKAAVDL